MTTTTQDGDQYKVGGPPPPIDGSPVCPAAHDCYFCTLDAGHAGQHVAGTFSLVHVVWPA